MDSPKLPEITVEARSNCQDEIERFSEIRWILRETIKTD